jgi:putative colanic acid biosynthesis acetyltransferase WcaF
MHQTDLSKYSNDWYQTGGSLLKRTVWYCLSACFLSSFFPFNGFKIVLLRLFGAKIGKGVVVKPRVTIKYPWNLIISDSVWIGEKVWIDNLALVKIGPNVCLSQEAFIFCGNHNYKKSTFDLMTDPVILEEGVWIGARSIVCPGVTCHSHAVLAAGSVANRNLEAYAVYQGNPALKVKERKME